MVGLSVSGRMLVGLSALRFCPRRFSLVRFRHAGIGLQRRGGIGRLRLRLAFAAMAGAPAAAAPTTLIADQVSLPYSLPD